MASLDPLMVVRNGSGCWNSGDCPLIASTLSRTWCPRSPAGGGVAERRPPSCLPVSSHLCLHVRCFGLRLRVQQTSPRRLRPADCCSGGETRKTLTG